MKPIRATITLRNNVLISARERLGYSQVQMAEHAGVPIGAYQDLERMEKTPDSKAKMRHMQSIADLIDMRVDEVFPEVVKSLEKNKLVAYFDPDDMRSLNERDDICLPEPETDRVIDIDGMLSVLTKRQKQVVEARFGLSGGREMTAKEVGESLGITPVRVVQLQNSAFRRIRSGKYRAMS